jgi:N-acetylglucosamine transport system permease protein
MQKKGRSAFIVSFLAPAVLLYVVFVIYPLIQAFGFSTYRWRGLSSKRTFVGSENFVKLIHDDVFLRAVRNNLTVLVLGGFAIVAISIGIAHALQSDRPSMKFLRGLILFPQMVSLVAVAILWQFLYNPQFGIFLALKRALHLDSFLGDPHAALPSVGITFVWSSLGFTIMLFSAGLRALPAEVVEACALDGATGMTRFWRVTWPMLWSVKRVAIVNITITVMNIFALIYLMTQGGPDRATEVMLTYLYQTAFVNSQFGYATAIAVANFVIIMILSVAILFFTRRNPEVSR